MLKLAMLYNLALSFCLLTIQALSNPTYVIYPSETRVNTPGFLNVVLLQEMIEGVADGHKVFVLHSPGQALPRFWQAQFSPLALEHLKEYDEVTVSPLQRLFHSSTVVQIDAIEDDDNK